MPLRMLTARPVANRQRLGLPPLDDEVLPSFSTFEGPTPEWRPIRSPGGVTASLLGGPSPTQNEVVAPGRRAVLRRPLRG
jgi:hypothetical protein